MQQWRRCAETLVSEQRAMGRQTREGCLQQEAAAGQGETSAIQSWAGTPGPSVLRATETRMGAAVARHAPRRKVAQDMGAAVGPGERANASLATKEQDARQATSHLWLVH